MQGCISLLQDPELSKQARAARAALTETRIESQNCTISVLSVLTVRSDQVLHFEQREVQRPQEELRVALQG